MSNASYSNIYLQEHWNRQCFNDGMVFFPKEREAASVAINVNSILRNTASAVKNVVSLPVLVSASAVLGGVLGVPIALSITRDAFKRGKEAFSCGDVEGVAHSALWGTVGTGYTAVSAILATDGIMGLQGGALPAAVTPLFGGAGLAMSGALLLYSGYGYKQSRQFNQDLQTILEQQGEREVLNWLHGQISLTKAELDEIRRTAKDPEREMANVLRKKWNALELRTSPDCAALLREKLPELFKTFDLKEAKILIEQVVKANFMKRVKHITLIVIALISIAAFICLLVASGPASPILFAVGAAVWLAIDSSRLHKYIGEKCWNWHHKDTEAPCQTQPLAI